MCVANFDYMVFCWFMKLFYDSIKISNVPRPTCHGVSLLFNLFIAYLSFRLKTLDIPIEFT